MKQQLYIPVSAFPLFSGSVIWWVELIFSWTLSPLAFDKVDKIKHFSKINWKHKRFYSKIIHDNSSCYLNSYLRAQEPPPLLPCLVQFWWILDLLHLVLISLSPHIECAHVCVWDSDDVLCVNKWIISFQMMLAMTLFQICTYI